MLTKLTIRNFKQFDDVVIDLGNPVVFIGPNNSGKTTALQALAIWHIGLRRWLEKRSENKPSKRPGVAINRRDLVSAPVSDAKLLWRDLHVRESNVTDGKQRTRNIRVEVVVEGVTNSDAVWECGLEFDFANSESVYCRPLGVAARTSASAGSAASDSDFEQAARSDVALLPPMSGLVSNEVRLDRGAIDVRLGEGRTAEVLRNLCYLLTNSGSDDAHDRWMSIVDRMRQLFGCTLLEPEYIRERGEIRLTYRDQRSPQTVLDLSSSGRGFQQTLLLLAHMACNPKSVLLLDEPDAHLEILRQRQIYGVLTEVASELGCQIIAASHSEVVLEEAADKHVVVAFVGRPHRIDDRGVQLAKSLKSIGFNQYYQAEQKGWVLYLEGATDLAILQAFARRLQHPADDHLKRPFVHYVGNRRSLAEDHFYGLLEARRNFVGLLIGDRNKKRSDAAVKRPLTEYYWNRREIENYLCQPETLLNWAAKQFDFGGPLFAPAEGQQRRELMDRIIARFAPPAALEDLQDKWWRDEKVSGSFLERVFEEFTRQSGLPPGHFRKNDFHQLADYVPPTLIDPEVSHVLDLIVTTASRAQPRKS